MIKEFKIYDSTTVEYNYSEAEALQVVSKIVEWCEKYNISSGESLVQSDNGTIYSPELVADIIDDVLKFKAKWDEEF